jgi:amidase
VRIQFRSELDVLFEGVDMLIAPCMPGLPATLEEMNSTVASEDARAEFITFTAPFDYSGHPTITLPAGLAGNGLPKSFQLVGRTLGEPTLIHAGSAYERALGFQAHPVD